MIPFELALKETNDGSVSAFHVLCGTTVSLRSITSALAGELLFVAEGEQRSFKYFWN